MLSDPCHGMRSLEAPGGDGKNGRHEDKSKGSNTHDEEDYVDKETNQSFTFDSSAQQSTKSMLVCCDCDLRPATDG